MGFMQHPPAQAFQNAGNELSSALSKSSESLTDALGALAEKLNVTQTSITSLNQSMTNTSTGLNTAKDAIDFYVKQSQILLKKGVIYVMMDIQKKQ